MRTAIRRGRRPYVPCRCPRHYLAPGLIAGAHLRIHVVPREPRRPRQRRSADSPRPLLPRDDPPSVSELPHSDPRLGRPRSPLVRRVLGLGLCLSFSLCLSCLSFHRGVTSLGALMRRKWASRAKKHMAYHGNTWHTHGKHMSNTCHTHVKHMGYTWHTWHMSYTWHTMAAHGIHMAYTWNTHRIRSCSVMLCHARSWMHVGHVVADKHASMTEM